MHKNLCFVVGFLLVGCVHMGKSPRWPLVSEGELQVLTQSLDEKKMPELFGALDRDGNGKLTPTEIASTPEWISKSDTNGDGVVSITEFLLKADAAAGRPANQARVCVGNLGAKAVSWDLKSGVRPVDSTPVQNPGQWVCDKVKDLTDYEVRIAIKENPYATLNCYVPVRGQEWIETFVDEKESDAALTCVHHADGAIADDVLPRPFGYRGEAVIRGKVLFDEPVESADIKVFDSKGKLIREDRSGTAKDGSFSVRLPSVILGGFSIETVGGVIDGKAFTETLHARVGKYDYSYEILNVTPATTIVAVLPGETPDVESKVKAVLGIDSFDDFDSKKFVKEAQTNGGFASFVRGFGDRILKGESLNFSKKKN